MFLNNICTMISQTFIVDDVKFINCIVLTYNELEIK